ncbi:MAG: class I tRNA ligase family protein [Thermoplasmata archaeon]|jgi:leucyl-tRNA synthetase|nr:class I tRNA ligase family protein [Thermoplasmata archaeon]
MDPSRDAHWQEAWAGAGLSRGRRVPGHRKFYALVAYPGPSGFLHVGHLRGYAYADPLHRYHRMRGEEVLFPFGVHASGLPAVTWSRKLQNGDPSILEALSERGIDAAARARLEDPEEAARFLGREYLRVFRRFGALIDESTFLTTVDEDYRAFIRWQFHTLHAAGALVRASYFSSVCPVCGPVAVDPSETDLQSGGDAEIVKFTTVPFRLDDGRILLAATLRPETVFGVTNVWVAPDEMLVVWHHDSGAYLMARPGAERMVEQHGGHLGHEVPVASLRGRQVHVPLRDTRVPILESAVVDPGIGTGIVMSVPAHAPADFAAIGALSGAERARLGAPPVLLEIDANEALSSSEEALRAGEGLPAERALRAVGATSLAEGDAVQEATERLYRLEFVRGRMTVPALKGVPVRRAREQVASQLLPLGGSFELQEFTKPVICRNGHTVVIRRVPEQWFLHYSDPDWKAETKELASRITTWPSEYGRELPSILDWFGDRPSTRRGAWLGTRFPLDPEWIIEPIADSTFYMAYFVVRRFVRDGRLKVDDLSDAFFDFVFRGQGSGDPAVDRGVQEEVREEFRYWYPLDFNIGGKEHKRVHFPVFLYTHVRLVPPELQPRGIFVHGWITGPAGAKISKKEVSSKGGKIPSTDRAMEEWGPDPIRLYFLLAASPSQDFQFEATHVDAARSRLGDIERLVREAIGDAAGPPELDAWLESATHDWVRRAHAAFEATDLRRAAEIVYVEVPALLRRYYTRGGSPGRATDRLVRAWNLFLSPITPHLAEEVGVGRFSSLVARALLPAADTFASSPAAEARESYLDQVEEDLRAVQRASEGRGEGSAGELIFYVADPWKATLESWLRDEVDRKEPPSVRDIMTRVKDHPELVAHRGEIPKYVERVGASLRSEPPREGPEIDEVATLRAAEGYLVRRFGFRSVTVHRESEAAEHDPKGRRDRARPGRPAFYLVGRPAPGA